MPVLRLPHAGKAVTWSKTGCVHPPQTAPGLGPPRTWNGAWIQHSHRMPNEMMCVENDPSCNSIWWGPDGAETPREGGVSLLPQSKLLKTARSIRFFANLFTSALASQRGFYSFFFTRFQVKGVAFNLFDNVFLLHFAFEAAQSVFEGFTLLQSNFRQTDTPPNPSGRTE
jgi:hypothetical protein